MTDARSPQRTEQRLPQRARGAEADRYYIRPEEKDPNFEYNWKAETVLGQENTEHLIQLEEKGWTTVHIKDIPRFGGSRIGPDQPIRRGGQVLMKLPKEYAAEARMEDAAKAKEKVDNQMARLGRQNVGGKGMSRQVEAVPD